MRTPNKALITFLFIVAVGLLNACGGRTTVESDLGIKDAPDWVNKGTAFVDDKGGRLLHGVGSAPAMGDQALQISTADDRARAELARILTTYMDVASRDYRAASGSGTDTATDQSVTRQIDALTKVNLAGAQIIGHWHDKHSGTIYSIAELDVKQIKETVGHVEDMDTGLQRYIQDNADNIFDRVSSKGK
jgi:hypothetical protein